MRSEITQEWLDCSHSDEKASKDLSASIFWRLALFSLPEMVNAEDVEVLIALEKIQASIARRRHETEPQ